MGLILHAALHSADPLRAEQCRLADEADRERDLSAFRRAVFFKAKHGRRRSFLSQSDADAYDAGWTARRFNRDVAFDMGTPFAAGWFDAEHLEEHRADER